MCAASQHAYSRIYHMLVSAYAGRWADRYLGMFTIYIDDSGTAPEQRMAVASGIIFPALRIRHFESEWNAFLLKEGISEFHTSECLAHNQHSEFAGWDDERVRRVFARVRQITFKYSVKGFCIGIHKKDYDEVLTADMKEAVGESHYTWAVSSLIGLAEDWATARGLPIEYVFDNEGKPVKREIISAMEFIDEVLYPGRFTGHWSFRKRIDVPALQAVDLFAWTCFQQFRHVRFGDPIHSLAKESNLAYEKAQNGEWRVVQSLHRQGIEDWVTKNRDSQRTQEILAFKRKKRAERQQAARTKRQKNS